MRESVRASAAANNGMSTTIISLCSAASFEVNSEPHTVARPSVRLCVGLIKDIEGYQINLPLSSNSSIKKSYGGDTVFPVIDASGQPNIAILRWA